MGVLVSHQAFLSLSLSSHSSSPPLELGVGGEVEPGGCARKARTLPLSYHQVSLSINGYHNFYLRPVVRITQELVKSGGESRASSSESSLCPIPVPQSPDHSYCISCYIPIFQTYYSAVISFRKQTNKQTANKPSVMDHSFNPGGRS